jgi:hypothetical protein
MLESAPEYEPLEEFADRWRRAVLARNDYSIAGLLWPDSQGLLTSARLRDWFYGGRDSHRAYFRRHPTASPLVLILPDGPREYGLVRICWGVAAANFSWPMSLAAWEGVSGDHLCVIVQADREGHWYFDDDTMREEAYEG